MSEKKAPEAIDDAVLDDISGGPTEELFGAYNLKLSDSSGYIAETEKGVWKAPAGLEATVKRNRG